MSLNYYDSWLLVSSSPKEQYIEDLQAFVDEQFENASNIYIIKKKNNTTDIYEDVTVRLDTPYELKQISSRVDDFRRVIFSNTNINTLIGDMYQFNNSHWLCTDANIISKPTKSCMIERCKNIITFQLQDNTIYTIPCILYDKSSSVSDGREETKYFPLADDQILIIVQNNSITLQLRLDKRFVFKNDENEIYKLTKIQKLTYNGLLYLTMTKDVLSANDRVDLNICDYFEITPQPEPTPTGYSIIIEGDDSVIKGRTATYTAKVYSDNIEVTRDIVWSIANEDTTSTLYATIESQTNNSCVIKGVTSPKYVLLKATLFEDNSIIEEKRIYVKALF